MNWYKKSKDQTKTPEFKKWFGEWDHPDAYTSRETAPSFPSLGMDKEKPRVFYHGTRGDFTNFEVGREGWSSDVFGPYKSTRHAIFFTEDPEIASIYTSQGGEKSGGNIIPVYLNIRQPLDFTQYVDEETLDEFEKNGISRRWLINFKWSHLDDEDGKNFVEVAKKLGYDAVIFYDENPATRDSFISWAVFDPSQIKSAIGNVGKFDPANPDITAKNSKNLWKKSEHVKEWEMTSDEFVNYHRTRSIPKVKEKNSFKWYDRKNYKEILESKIFRGIKIDFCKSKLELTKIVAFDRDKAVGIASEYVDIRLGNDKTGDGIWVHPDYRGIGIGLELITLFRKHFSDERRIGEMSPLGENLVRKYHKMKVLRAIEDGFLTTSHPKYEEIMESIKK